MALKDGILAYWKLDNSSWIDSTGNGYTLVNAGSSDVSTGSGIIGGGAGVDSSAYLYNGDIAVGDSYSVSIWVNPISFASNVDTAWSFNDANSATGVVGQGQCYFFVGNKGEGDYNLNPGYPQANGWTHLVYVIDNTNHLQNFYVNGNLIASGNDTGNWGNWNGFYLGAYPGRGLSSNSNIDEVGLWTRALSGAEVGDLYGAGAGLPYPLSVLYYSDAQEDGDWGNLLNWWQDSSYTVQATALPSSSTPVILYNHVTQNSAEDNCYCRNANFFNADFESGLTLSSTGAVNFWGNSAFKGTTSSNTTMHDSSTISSTGVVHGNVVMRDGSSSLGLIDGNVDIYYDGGDGNYPIGGTVTGTKQYHGFNFGETCYFNNAVNDDWTNSRNWWIDSAHTIWRDFIPDITNNVVFNYDVCQTTDPSSYTLTVKSAVLNNCNFGQGYGLNLTAVNGVVLNNSRNGETINANTIFNNSRNTTVDSGGTVNGNAVFNGHSYNVQIDQGQGGVIQYSTVSGNVDAYYPAYVKSAGIGGTLTRHGYTLNNTCDWHWSMDETSGTRHTPDLYLEPEYIYELVLGGGSTIDGTYYRSSGRDTYFYGTRALYYDPGENIWTVSDGSDNYYCVNDGTFSNWSTYGEATIPSLVSSQTRNTAVGYSAGKFGNASLFNGTNCLYNANLVQASDFTISGWVNFSNISSGAAQAIIGTANTAYGGYGNPLTIYLQDGVLRMYDDSLGHDIAGPSISANTWYNFVGVYSGETFSFYVNGVNYGSASCDGYVYFVDFSVSKFFDAYPLPAGALVDELNVFNVALTESQITELYSMGDGFIYPFIHSSNGISPIVYARLLNLPFFIDSKSPSYGRLLGLPWFINI